jgi:AcrR family transcriptional regulator
MRDIAGEVGILAGSLYAHIEGKEALLHEIIDVGIDDFLESAGVVVHTDARPDWKMRELIKQHVRLVAKNPQATLIVFHQWRYLGPANRERVRGRRHDYENLFTTVIEEGIDTRVFAPGIDVRIAVLAVLGALNWTPEWLSPDGPASADDIGGRLADAMLAGMLRR